MQKIDLTDWEAAAAAASCCQHMALCTSVNSALPPTVVWNPTPPDPPRPPASALLAAVNASWAAAARKGAVAAGDPTRPCTRVWDRVAICQG